MTIFSLLYLDEGAEYRTVSGNSLRLVSVDRSIALLAGTVPLSALATGGRAELQPAEEVSTSLPT